MVGKPGEGLGNVCFINEDVSSSLGKSLQYKGSEPGVACTPAIVLPKGAIGAIIVLVG